MEINQIHNDMLYHFWTFIMSICHIFTWTKHGSSFNTNTNHFGFYLEMRQEPLYVIIATTTIYLWVVFDPTLITSIRVIRMCAMTNVLSVSWVIACIGLLLGPPGGTHADAICLEPLIQHRDVPWRGRLHANTLFVSVGVKIQTLPYYSFVAAPLLKVSICGILITLFAWRGHFQIICSLFFIWLDKF